LEIFESLTPTEKEQVIRADFQAVIDELFRLCGRIADKYGIYLRLYRQIADIDTFGAETVFSKPENKENPWKSTDKTAPSYDF